MFRHSSHGSDFGSDIGGLGGGIIVLAVIAIYLCIRMTAYIIQTFVKYHKVSKALWYSLYGFILLSLLGGVFSWLFDKQDFASLSSVGFLVLFLTCVVVQRYHANTFMVGEGMSIRQAVLEKSWWKDETTPMAA